MTFELHSKPLSGPLAEVWPDKVIRELPYRELRSAMATAPDEWRAELIVAKSIGVSLDELLDLPGRYAGAVAVLTKIVTTMHGLSEAPEELKTNGTEQSLENMEAPVAGKH